MSRSSRRLSKSQVYHVIIRGNERRKIFLCDEDRIKFIDILQEKSEEGEFSVLAYCLMDNHVHLMIREGTDQINRIMQRISVSYVYYFNKNYERTGHLFQDRFKSEPVENENYLLAVVRYIHNNPVKANLIEKPSQYRWSSYNAYIGRADNCLADREFVLKMFSDDEEKWIKMFVNFSQEEVRDDFMDVNEETVQDKKIHNEMDLRLFIKDFLSQKGISDTDNEWLKNTGIRNELFRDLKANTSLSIREIACILGVNRNIIQRA